LVINKRALIRIPCRCHLEAWYKHADAGGTSRAWPGLCCAKRRTTVQPGGYEPVAFVIKKMRFMVSVMMKSMSSAVLQQWYSSFADISSTFVMSRELRMISGATRGG